MSILNWIQQPVFMKGIILRSGLTGFTTKQRVKEIGIRKVLGATAFNIVSLLSREVLSWVIIALAAAIPFAYIMAERWLESFAYRISVEWWMFALSGVLTVIAALATVSYHSLKAAYANPVESIHRE